MSAARLRFGPTAESGVRQPCRAAQWEAADELARRRRAVGQWPTACSLVDYSYNILVPTSVHIPKALLAAADRKAKQLGISRNRLIVQALEREIERGWSGGFFDKLRSSDPAASDELRESMAVVTANRGSKAPVRL